MDVIIAFGLIVVLFAVLGSGLWIGLSLLAVALVGMELFTSRPVGDSMMLTIWGSTSSWTLTALPLFLWMGEILFRSKLSSSMFKGLAPWLDRLPGRLLHLNVVGCTIFAAISGSSAATCATIGKITLPELKQRGYPEDISVGTLAGAGTPGLLLAALFMGYIVVWALFNKDKVPAPDARLSFVQKLYASRHLIPVVSLIVVVLGAIYSGIATATKAAALGVGGSLILAKIEGSLDWARFKDGLVAACRVYCMIGLILAGAAFLTLAMGFIGLPRHLAEFIGALHLSPFALMLLLIMFFILLGCFLDGISMVVLTIAVLLPTVEAAGFDLVWFGIFIVLVVEMAQITPPVGFNLFVLQGMTRRKVTWIARTALPLFALMIVAVILTYFVPDVVLWLPRQMQG